MTDLWNAWLQYVDTVASHYWQCVDNSPVAGPLGTWMGDVSDLWLDWAKGFVPPVPPPGSQVRPGVPPSTTTVSVTAGSGVLRLRATAFADGNEHSISDALVSLSPSIVPGGQTRTVTVRVYPPVGVPGGVYAGAILDSSSAAVIERVVQVAIPT